MWIISLGNFRVLGTDMQPTFFLDEALEFQSIEDAEAAITEDVRALGGTEQDSVLVVRRPPT